MGHSFTELAHDTRWGRPEYEVSLSLFSSVLSFH